MKAGRVAGFDIIAMVYAMPSLAISLSST
jgi:hypothetical protein